MNNFLNGKSAAMMLALSLVNVTAAFAQDDNSSAKEEGNRNVMLNAASANSLFPNFAAESNNDNF